MGFSVPRLGAYEAIAWLESHEDTAKVPVPARVCIDLACHPVPGIDGGAGVGWCKSSMVSPFLLFQHPCRREIMKLTESVTCC